MKLRIHHFYDIIRDIGRKKPFEPHQYLHSYHTVARKIVEDPHVKLKIVIEADAVCKGCIHLVNSKCDDIITHRHDFKGKEDFNNHLDTRIIKICGIQVSDTLTPVELCACSEKYIENIFWIYEGNDPEHTRMRKNNVLKGNKYYLQKHNINIE